MSEYYTDGTNMPRSEKIPTSETLYGIELHDEYRWLEDVGSPQTQAWIDEQNKFTDEYINQHTERESWRTSAEKFVRREWRSMPVRKGRYTFYQQKHADNEYPSIFVTDPENEEPRSLLDVESFTGDGPASLDYWSPSHEGTLLAYGISNNGDEIASIRVRNVDTGEDLDDIIPNAQFASVSWLDDDSGFYYTRSPLDGEVPHDEARLHQKVYLHVLGDSVEKDELIFGKDRPKDDMVHLARLKNSPYLRIHASQEWVRNDIYLYNIETQQTTPLLVGLDAKTGVIATKDRFIVHTNYNAPNNQLFSIPYEDLDHTTSLDQAHVLLPESEHLLEWFHVSETKIFAQYSVDACDVVKVYDHDGQAVGDVPLPDIVVANMRTSVEDDEVYYYVETPVQPGAIYKLDAASLESQPYYIPETPHNPEEYEVRREWTTSKDGTRLPYFVTKRNDTEDNAPTILYGYGGFASSVTPTYVGSNMSWLESGGVYVDAVIRGGGEYGEQWHRDGMVFNKQNTFDDFIAIAEALIAKKVTTSDKLGIYGGSNGGLLVGAATTQRPELFKAAISAVPLLDMVHYHTLLIAGRWVHEYGDPGNEDELKGLLKWSPYHNIQPSTRYPAVLLTTAENDTRVHPMHALKMAAKLQNVDRPNTTLLRLEKASGHTGTMSTTKAVDISSERLAFFGSQLGLMV